MISCMGEWKIGLFFMLKIKTKKQNVNYDNLSGGGSRAHKDYTGMYRMQATQLQHDEGQEDSSWPYGNQKVLQILQETYHA